MSAVGAFHIVSHIGHGVFVVGFLVDLDQPLYNMVRSLFLFRIRSHNVYMPTPKNTSWEPVAEWYGKLLEGEGTYQKELILPNLLRLMDIRRGDAVLDLACGPGFFAREFI